MPTFDFHCAKCDHTFEFSRAFGNKEIPPCPECKNEKTEKQIAAPAIHFKGEGFYKTDSVPKPKPKKNPVTTESKDTKESSSDAKTMEDKKGAKPETQNPEPTTKQQIDSKSDSKSKDSN